ncbi:MAG: purine-nucleoside phosphorylase [Fusobacteriota bacterium]
MSIHIEAKKGEIAKTVLLPGDPLRAKFIAETFLEDVKKYNNVRGMYGYTGTFNGKRVSVQGTGMGIPSISIYATELIQDYGVENLIRIGSCGSITKKVEIRDIILAMSSSTDSRINQVRFKDIDFAPTADFGLLKKAYDIAIKKDISPKVGSVFTSDTFYRDNFDDYKKWAEFGILAVEMETAGLYTLAAKHGVNALAILTVSDSLVTGEATSSKERETTFTQMMEVALELA